MPRISSGNCSACPWSHVHKLEQILVLSLHLLCLKQLSGCSCMPA